MADHLASIYGTEKDKVNCSFYFKIGACRHGDRCSRKHVKPTFSQTVLLQNIYQNPGHNPFCTLDAKQLQEHFDAFYEDIFIELAKYGEVEKLNVCDNVGDHLVGNVYIKYRHEEDASNAVEALNNRFYSGRHIYAELSPVTDFGEACCRQYENSECVRNGFCNFMHLKAVTPKLARELYLSQEKYLQNLRMTKYSGKSRKRDSPKSSYDRSDHKGRRGRNYDGEDYRGESRHSRKERRWSTRHERELSDEESDKLKKGGDGSNHIKKGIAA